MSPKLFLTPLVLFGLASCASAPIVPNHLDEAQASIRGAEEVGASTVPAAQLHLQLAKDETATAQAMASKGDLRSSLVMARAESDAELALVLAREVTVHAAAVKAADDLKALRARGNP